MARLSREPRDKQHDFLQACIGAKLKRDELKGALCHCYQSAQDPLLLSRLFDVSTQLPFFLYLLIVCDEFGVNMPSYECKEIDTPCKESVNRIGKDTIACGKLLNIPWSR
jgi:hypothetical protein